MSTSTYYKAVRPDGTSFHDPAFRWVPEDWTPEDGRVRVEHPDPDLARGAGGYLSVSTEPADCTGMKWPCRLLIVQPVGEVLTPEPGTLPYKRAGRAFDVIAERPAHEALGPCGREVVSLLAELEAFTPTAWDAAWDAARYAVRDAAWDAARYAVLATLVRDVIAPEQYERLMVPVEAARAVMRETDSTTPARSDQ